MAIEITIIVPVYKAETFLHRCVDSILSQTFPNFELLLIDDGSPDRSGDICDEYAQKDSRVKVFHKENGGVSVARNMGITYAKGEWITFIDSDDYIDEKFLEHFGLDKYKTNIYLQGFKVIQNGKVIRRHCFPIAEYSIVPFHYLFYEGEMNNILNSPVCKLFKRDIIDIHKLRFDENISFGEDHLFVLSYLYHVDNATVSNSISYNYVFNDNASLTRSIIPFQKIVYYTTKTNQCQFDLVQNKKAIDNKYILKAIYWRTYSNIIVTIRNLLAIKENKLKNYKSVKSIYKYCVYGYAGLHFRQKMIQFIYLCFPTILSYWLLYAFIILRCTIHLALAEKENNLKKGLRLFQS